ncbi:MAG: hypothetical protein ACOCWA_05050 [Bacteroidota bacterium]
MKKVLSILTVVVFFLAVSAPVYSADVTSPEIVNVDDEKPKSAENKNEAKSEKTKSGDCQAKEKKSDCSSKKSKSCGDKGK